MSRATYVHGAAVSLSWADASQSLTDLIFAGVSAALRGAEVRISAIDSVVLAAHDLIDGRSLSSMVTAPAAGAYMRDEIRLSEDGLAAFSLAAARIEAGESEFTVVAAWGRASEGGFLPMSRNSMDPFLQQPFGISDIDLSAFRLSRWSAEYGNGGEARQIAAMARRDRAGANPRALACPSEILPVSFPLREDEAPKWADVVAAVILGSRPAPVRVAGLGHGTDAPQVGDRDLLRMPALAAAARTAMGQAGLDAPAIDLVEIDGMMLSDEVIAMEALGLCGPGEGFRAYAASDRVNQSGGAAAGWCYPAMGLVRAAEAYLRLRASEARRTALAAGLGGNGAQTSTALILEAE